MTRWVSGLSRLFADARYARKVLSTSDPTTAADSAAGYRIGDTWVNTATGNIWTAYDVTAGAAKWRHQPRILAQSAAASSHTGNTNETALATITIGANVLGANGRVELDAMFAGTSSANNKTARFRYNGIGGTSYGTYAVTTLNAWRMSGVLANRNATNSQVGRAAGADNAGWSAVAGAAAATAADTTAATSLVISGQLASGGETITLEWYRALLTLPDVA